MTEPPIRFEDGAAYERVMGHWSRLAGEVFLDWLEPAPGQRWLDVGCGNGAFTELIAERCTPAEIRGIDPSDGQLAYARTRLGTRAAELRQGSAMALPFSDASFDAATMALVIFFVPDPAAGVAEMTRVVRPGGTVATYVWDTLGGGFPLEPVQAELRALGIPSPHPPSVEASRKAALERLWREAGLEAVTSREITVQRSFADFDDFWATSEMAPGIGPAIAAMAPGEVERLKSRLVARLPADGQGRITSAARANAIAGRVPR